MTDFIGGSKDSPTAAAVGESVDNSIPGIIIEAEESSQNSNTLPPLPHSLVDRVDALYPRTAVPDWYMDDAENDGRQWYLGDASANTTSSVARGGVNIYISPISVTMKLLLRRLSQMSTMIYSQTFLRGRLEAVRC